MGGHGALTIALKNPGQYKYAFTTFACTLRREFKSCFFACVLKCSGASQHLLPSAILATAPGAPRLSLVSVPFVCNDFSVCFEYQVFYLARS